MKTEWHVHRIQRPHCLLGRRADGGGSGQGISQRL